MLSQHERESGENVSRYKDNITGPAVSAGGSRSTPKRGTNHSSFNLIFNSSKVEQGLKMLENKERLRHQYREQLDSLD